MWRLVVNGPFPKRDWRSPCLQHAQWQRPQNGGDGRSLAVSCPLGGIAELAVPVTVPVTVAVTVAVTVPVTLAVTVPVAVPVTVAVHDLQSGVAAIGTQGRPAETGTRG